MFQLYGRNADFEAEITVLTAEQGGRKQLPDNGIRWDFAYPEDRPTDQIYMIHPYFLDDKRIPLPKGQKVFGTKIALMFILSERMIGYHRGKVFVGMPFQCREGRRVVALGKVTSLHALGE